MAEHGQIPSIALYLGEWVPRSAGTGEGFFRPGEYLLGHAGSKTAEIPGQNNSNGGGDDIDS